MDVSVSLAFGVVWFGAVLVGVMALLDALVSSIAGVVCCRVVSVVATGLEG